MKRVFLLISLCLVAVAQAGTVIPTNVTIDTAMQTAYGNMVTARFSADDQEFIGCGQRNTLVGGVVETYGFCQARTTSAGNVICYAFDANLASKISGISDYSFITFRWNADGDCTSIGFSSQSFYIPE